MKRLALEWEEAEELNLRLIEIDPSRAWSYTHYAWTLAHTGRFEEAVRQCSLAVRINPAAYNTLAWVYDQKGDPENALRAADKYIESDSLKYDAYDTKANIFRMYGVLDSAIVYYEKALEIKPDFAPALFGLGDAHMFLREYTRSENFYQEMASHTDRNQRAGGRLAMTQVLRHQGRFGDALDLLAGLRSAAIADSLKDDNLASGIFRRGKIYLHILDEPQLAITEFEEAQEVLNDIFPGSWKVVASRGSIAVCHARMGDFAAADRLMQELEADIDRYGPGKLAVYWEQAGELEMEKGNFDSALVLVGKLNQNSAWSIDLEMLAQCYLGAGRLDEAIATFEEAVLRYDWPRAQFTESGVLMHFHLGQAYEAAGRDEDAIAQYETFLDIWKNADEGIPSVEDARTRLTRLKTGS
jgi:tetratricopeptide (TPR) repeat protein